MKLSNSVAAVEGLSSGEIEKVQDLDESIGSCEDVTSGKTSVIDKPKSCILSESLESVVHEDIHIKTVKSDKLCTDNVKLNFVGDGAQSSNQKEKSRIFRGRSSKNLNQSTLNRKIVGLSSLKKDANKLLNDDVEQAIVCDKAVKDTSSYENGKAVIVTEQHTAKFIKHSVKSEPLIEHSDAVIAVKTTDIVAKAVRLSRSGRVISSPKKYNGYDTDLGQGGKCADPGEVFSSQKEGFCSSSGTSRKRGIKSFIDNNPVKKFKLVTEKNNTVTVLSDVESGSVGEPKVARVSLDLSMVKSEVTDDPVEVGPQEDPHGRSQVMQAEISPEGVITLTECILDKSGNPISLGNSAPDPSFITDNDVSNISPDFDQQECTVSTVVVKSDPDAEQDDGKPSPIELSGDEDISEPNSDPQYLGTEDQCESSEVLHDGREEEVTGDMDNHIVVISAEDKSEDGQLTYEALINLASEAVNQVEDYDNDMVYQVQLGNGKVTHFMVKRQDEKAKSGDNAEVKIHHGQRSRKTSDKCDAKLLTSEQLEKQEQLLGRTLKGRSRPVKQMVVKKELQELVDNIKPSDSIEQHVIIEPTPREKDLTAGSYRVRGKQMRCKYCDRLLHDRHDFYKHIRTHPEIDYRPYACPLCDYKANIKAAVVRHINIHSEVMPYVCTLCGRGFNFKQKLQTHMKYHKDIRDYQCPNCPLAFHEYKTLKNHIRIIHGLNTMMPSGEEAKGLRHRAATLSRLAATKPQQKIRTEESVSHEVIEDEDVIQDQNSKVSASVDSNHKMSTVKALPACEDMTSDDASSFSCDVSQNPEENIHPAEQHEKGDVTKTPQDRGSFGMNSSGNNSDSEEQIFTNPVYVSGERRRLRLSKYIGTKKTQLITERYREGLTKFGASHEEITASCPWRSSTKVRHHGVKTEVISTSPDHVVAVEFEPNGHIVSESFSAVASIEQPASIGLTASSSGLVEECIASDDQTISGVDQPVQVMEKSGQRSVQSTDSSNQMVNGPVVYIQPLNRSSQPPANTVQKTPFVSLRNLTSTFTEVCEVEQCKDDKQTWCKYHCRLCDHITYNKTFMVDHIQTRHTEIKLWQCPNCDYKCRLRSSIFVHLKMHEGNKKYKCDQCGKCFTLYSKLKNHLYTHSTSAEFKCEQCDKKFKRRSDLKKHEDRIHNPDRPFRCEVCDKTFKDKVQIKRHMDSHIEGRNLLCQVCKKYYKNRSSLQQHLKSHMCRFYCELCSKSFGSYSGFMAHKVMHTESFTGFHCDLCGKVLHTKGSLNRHLTISHSTARPYPCLQCKSAFKTKKDLRNHAIVHCSTKNFECSVCGFKSKRCESLHVHMRRHQDVKPYRCGICNKEYMQRRSLQLHLPYHLTELQVRCSICNKRCMTRSHLQQHMKREHGDVDTDLAVMDISKKNSATFYMCEECNSVFLTQDSLAVHILVQHMNQPHDLKVQLKSADATAPSANKQPDSEETETSGCNVNMNSVDSSEDGNVIESLFNVVNAVDSKESMAQYVAVTDPKSKEKRVITVMHPIGDGMMSADTSQNVEVEGEVVMNISDALTDISGAINKMEPLQTSEAEDSIHGVLHDANDAVVAVPMDAVSMAFVMPKDIDYPQVGDPESIVSFMDPGTNEEFSVSMPPQTLVNLLTPAMETEVVSSTTMEDLSTPGDMTLVSAEDTVMVSLADTVITTNSDNSQGFSSVIETVDTKDSF